MRRSLLFPALVFASLLAFGCDDDPRTRTDSGPGGMCVPECTAPTVCCNARCANFQTDPTNCGSCGNACAPGQSCTSGTCTGMAMDSGPGTDTGGGGGMCSPSCSSMQRCCGVACVNRSAPAGVQEARSDSSFGHCNGCGFACDPERATRCASPPGGGAPSCLCGNTSQCAAGDACILSESGTYLCTNLQTDSNNCGEVGNRCNPGETCNAGSCGCGGAGPCAAGQGCCGGSCVDVTSDAMNCGECGNVCPMEASACESGMCVCPGATGPCTAPGPGSLGQSCCPGMGCVDNSDTSCGCEPCTGDTPTCTYDMGFPGFSDPALCCAEPDPPPFGACGFGGGFPMP